jgi:hypothetical protein
MLKIIGYVWESSGIFMTSKNKKIKIKIKKKNKKNKKKNKKTKNLSSYSKFAI